MFVSTRSPTLLALLLLMVTIQPYHLLPTEQSSLVPSLERPPIEASNLSIITSRTMLGDVPDDVKSCLDTIFHDDYPDTGITQCHSYQDPWLELLLKKGVHQDYDEYKCKDGNFNLYCNNLVAHQYCPAQDSADFTKEVERKLEEKAHVCSQWDNCKPPMDSPAPIPIETVECGKTLEKNGAKAECTKEANETIAKENIADLTELWCKTTFASEKCIAEAACKHCNASAIAFLLFKAKLWTPRLVECIKWPSEKPRMDCAAPKSTTPPQAGSCLSVLDQKGIPERCDNESQVKYPDPTHLNVEIKCRAAFYSFDCGMKAACEQCNDTKDYVDMARKVLDTNAALCKPWLGDEPTLKCPSNMILLIVGIVLAVVIILVVICVVVYCICFTDKSERRSSSKGGKRSKPKCSTPRSRNKAGSSIEAKQTSRAAAGTKKQSSRMASCGPVKKQSRASKGAKPRSRVKQSKRSRASAVK